jgi:prolyl 4-hydroxylase
MASDNFIFEKYIADLNLCNKIIDVYNASPHKKLGQIGEGINLSVKESTDVNIPLSEASKYPSILLYMSQLQTVCEAYIKKYSICNKYDPWAVIEPVNIQHYKPTQGYHAWHTERTTYKKPANSRHLVFMTYLNDVNDKGETEFYYQKIKVKPRKGLTLIWPADWTHTHRGIASPTEDKYIITGWYSFYLK